MLITAFFNDINSLPITGLTPHLNIYDIENDVMTITAAHMVESSLTNIPGWYEYDFTTIDTLKVYIVSIDGGVALANNIRYQYGQIEPETAVTPFVEF